MAGGAGKLPKWQIVLADPIGWQEWLQPAKMAESGRKLPKWQASANIVPNTMPNWHSKYRAKQNLFPLIFSACFCRYLMYDHGKERKEPENV